MPNTVGFATHGYAVYVSKSSDPNYTVFDMEQIHLQTRNFSVDHAIFANTTNIATIRTWISSRTHSDVNMNLIASAMRKLYLATYPGSEFEVIG